MSTLIKNKCQQTKNLQIWTNSIIFLIFLFIYIFHTLYNLFFNFYILIVFLFIYKCKQKTYVSNWWKVIVKIEPATSIKFSTIFISLSCSHLQDFWVNERHPAKICDNFHKLSGTRTQLISTLFGAFKKTFLTFDITLLTFSYECVIRSHKRWSSRAKHVSCNIFG